MPKETNCLKLGKGAAFVKTRLKQIRQEDDVWEVDFRALPKPMMQTATHYVGQVVTQADGILLADQFVERTPTVNDLAELLSSAMRRPLADRPRRPHALIVRKNPRWKELLPHLKDIGVEVILQDELPVIESSFRDYLRYLNDHRCSGKSTLTTEEAAVEKTFSAISRWVNEGHGHIEIGDQEGFGFVARALNDGGVVVEDMTVSTFAEALVALESSLSRWFSDEGAVR